MFPDSCVSLRVFRYFTAVHAKNVFEFPTVYSHRYIRVAIATIIGRLRYGDYGLRTTAGRALPFVCSTGLSRANIER